MAIELKLSAITDTPLTPLDKSGSISKEGASQTAPATPLNFMALLNQLDAAGTGAGAGAGASTLAAETTSNDKADVALNAADAAALATVKEAIKDVTVADIDPAQALDSAAILAQMQMAWCKPTPQTAVPAVTQSDGGATPIASSSASATIAIDAKGGNKNALIPEPLVPTLASTPIVEDGVNVARSQDTVLPFTRLLKAEHLVFDTAAPASVQASVLLPGAAKLVSDTPVASDTAQALSSTHGQVAHNWTSKPTLTSALYPERAADALISLSSGAMWGESFRQMGVFSESEKSSGQPRINAAVVGDRTGVVAQNSWDFSTKFSVTLSTPSEATASAAMANTGAEQQVANQVSMWVAQNVQSAELKLDAFGADPVEVSIALTGNEAQVQFRSDVAETREMLSRAATQLDAALQREGFVLSGFSVGTSAQGRDNPREDAGALAKNSLRKGNGGPAQADPVHLNVSARTSRGAVDLFV